MKQENFIKLYLNDVAYFYDIPKSTSNLIFELFNYITNTNEIILNMEIKKRIAKDLDISVRTIDNNLHSLVKKKLLNKNGVGVFILNNDVFGNNDWKTIKDLNNQNLNLEIIYNKENNKREIKVMV